MDMMAAQPGEHAARPYDGVRVLDLTTWLGRYASRLFADLGAEVIRIEPPGHVTCSPDYARAFLDASKSSVTLDLMQPADRAVFERLAADAAIVMLERDGPLADDLAWVRSLNPQAVITYVSPYGLDGPLAASPASDLTLQAAGGLAWLSGRPGEPPLRLPVEQSVMITSVYAAVATALCLLDAETGGTGHVVDVSAQEAIAHSLQNALQVFDLEGRISRRGGEGTRDASEDIFACKDGAVFLAAPPPLGVSWKALLGWMAEAGDPAHPMLLQPQWMDRAYRNSAPAKAAFRTMFEAFIRDKTRAELALEAIARKIVMSPVSRIADVLDDEQLVHRDYFTVVDDPAFGPGTLMPGAPYRLSEPVWRVSGAPTPGQHTDAILRALAPV